MNNILVKILCCLFIVTTINSDAAANNQDTTTLLAGNNINSSTSITIAKAANVVYPEFFEDDKSQYIDYVKKFSNKQRDYIIEMHHKGENYFPKIIAVLNKYDLPEEFKVLIALESGFKANAVSPAGATGYWQLMNETAKDYGLRIADFSNSSNTNINDERKNLIKSTTAAAKYLHNNSKSLKDDILLTVASYNCGMGKIKQALKRSGKPNGDFWGIKKYLPAETRKYVMNFIALNLVFANYEKFRNKILIFNSELIEVPLNNATKLNLPITD